MKTSVCIFLYFPFTIIPYSYNIAKHKNKNPYLKIKFYKIVCYKNLANKNFCFIL
ncbi:hypothetical protein HMPREF1866_00324 [Lachnoanaerobaculum saburreum]|uniref:Uncharacterized protein n=1 Tax=Lachnoanaerobaculum saburreum TaxID=467210 RepID=A0A133ZZK1_9FIRM|nr:hypothetical protein HMPREF1866_00324 [Lachnoanaerobaculum saburreum]